MAAQDKAALKADIDNDIVTGVPGGILPSVDNARRTDFIDSFLNVVESSAQTVAGPVDYTGGLTVNGSGVKFLCAESIIESEQDWIDSTTLVSGSRRKALPNHTYIVCGSVSRSFELVTNGFTTIKGDNPNIDIDNYTGTGTAWLDDAALGGLTIIRSSCKGVAGSGSSFISQTNISLILSVETAFIEFDSIGTTDAIIITALRLAFGSVAIPMLSGLVITSQNAPTISFSNCAMRMSDVVVLTGIDMTTATSVSSIGIQMSFSGGAAVGTVGIKAAPNSGNLLANARGIISDSNFRTVNTPLSGITVDDLKWTTRDNQGIQDTMPDGYATSIAGGTTTIVSAGSSVVMNAIFTDRGSSQFTVSAGGRLTYIGLDPLRITIDLGASVQPVSGTNKNLFIELALNGTPLFDAGEKYSKSGNRCDNGDPKYISTFAQITLNTNDYIEAFVGNDTDAVDVICTNIKLRVN